MLPVEHSRTGALSSSTSPLRRRSPDASGDSALSDLIVPGYGSDDDAPESAVAEGLYQVVAGDGVDGNGDIIIAGKGGSQVAGALATQTSGDAMCDWSAFSTLDPRVAISSGTVEV
jgi:hypothetical protein